MRQNLGPGSRPVGVTGHGVPVIGFGHVPGVAPVAVARVPENLPVGPAGGGAHTHDFLALFYAHRADGAVLIDGRRWTVTDGDVFVIAPGQVVSLRDPHEEVATDGWVVWFPADVVRPGMSGAYSSWRAHPLLFPFAQGTDRAQRLRIPAADRAGWVERFAVLDAELRARRDGHQEAALAHLTLLLVAAARLSTGVADQLRSSDEPLLAAVFDAIEQRYHEGISLADVAAELALTAGHLTTVVRRKTGRTVQQWIAQRRMQQARLLLTETDLTVAAISRRVGYPDVSYFIKRFRADHGVTPGQWRDTALPTR
ncbi:AraC family transcriptional regulator [Plantactinospora sp. KLBMP9567]|uniref:AraC family transcriptional regulator n=1 Tax=Plantactinospora sp. KLBMP9567 TaxID=3085900 RepID=UPI0029813084|nr:AraC family transcriptional regulator [Plantactinospora sp. KLBMP9567]MDW5324358.1 AraC family transcriptional regulator [Plantactinospora sp. KLBMP9567]